MRRMLLAGIAALSLVACQTAAVDTSIQSTLSAVCPTLNQAHAAFLVVAARSDRAAEYVDTEAQAYASIRVACSNPAAVNSSNVLVYIASAYAAWEIAGVK